MSKPHIPYFNFYPADFMNGVRGLSAQEVGVYTMILCRIYEENGPVEYHPMRLATYCGMRENTFAKVIEKLVDLGKLKLSGGMIGNTRAEAEISKRANDLKNNSKAGKASAKKRQEKQSATSTGVQRAFNHTDTDTDTDKDGSSSKELPPSNGGGERADSGVPEAREKLLEAMGVGRDGIAGPSTFIGSTTDMAEAERWSAMGLSVSQQCEVIREVCDKQRGKHPGWKPSTFRYFTPAMERLTAAKSLPAESSNAAQIERWKRIANA
jgi:uncharacterized protein YdaU (DUF1376 family)